ncbi:hypothetical protein [Marinifilum fragile]|uniref:hypothetical protein n=1 Tax=Marinifilum fragile TaxID=570161 RepID=UPI002AA891D6|nr:hypothetical protein [Marinifilum fragile]
MEKNRVRTRSNTLTDELQREVTRVFEGYKLKYTEVYYLDDKVDEDTGMIQKGEKAMHYKSDQVKRNLKALKKVYNQARMDADPN